MVTLGCPKQQLVNLDAFKYFRRDFLKGLPYFCPLASLVRNRQDKGGGSIHRAHLSPDVLQGLGRWEHSSHWERGCQMGQPEQVGRKEVLQDAGG